MSKTNRGKDFENVVRDCISKVPGAYLTRLPDPVQGYLGYRNVCDFLVYRCPYYYLIECKSVHGNRLPFSNVTDNQWNGMMDAHKVSGIIAGVMCWWVDKDVTRFIPIQLLEYMKRSDKVKSYPYEFVGYDNLTSIEVDGRKKRVFYDYNMSGFFDAVEKSYRNGKMVML